MKDNKPIDKTLSAEGKTSKRKILIVDDQEMIIRFVSLKFKSAGYDVITASNGKVALELVKSEKPDVMALDIIMPVMDGFAVLKKLRPKSALPVIVFSAHMTAGKLAISLGANDFINKPFDPKELVKKVEKLMNC